MKLFTGHAPSMTTARDSTPRIFATATRSTCPTWIRTARARKFSWCTRNRVATARPGSNFATHEPGRSSGASRVRPPTWEGDWPFTWIPITAGFRPGLPWTTFLTTRACRFPPVSPRSTSGFSGTAISKAKFSMTRLLTSGTATEPTGF